MRLPRLSGKAVSRLMRSLVILALSLLIGCATAQVAPSATAEDLAVISAALRDPHIFENWGMTSQPALVANTSAGTQAKDFQFAFWSYSAVNSDWSGMGPEMLESLKARNGKSVRLGSGSIGRLPLLTGAALERFKPSRVVKVSLPGYDKLHSRAVVAIELNPPIEASCCSSGYIAFLERHGKGWSAVGQGNMWVE